MVVCKRPDPCACIEILPYNQDVAYCPSCRQKLRFTVVPCCGKTPHAATSPTYVLQTKTPSLPQNTELRWLNDTLQATLQALRLSGWYYTNLDWQGARSILKETSPGAFVIRESGDKNFIFSLSVQTERGPTSVRLHYERGYFRLDCDNSLARYMPRFQCVVELVQHYSGMGTQSSAGTVWVDRDGCPHSPVLLKTPLRKSPPSLLHSARLATHKALESNPLIPRLRSAPKHRQLPLPPPLLDYLGQYPYWI